jgi:uncharacterized circularly permuted ATP-grasp superfamily protein
MQGMTMIKMTLPSAPYYDEMLTAEGQQRQHYDAWWHWLQQTDQHAIHQKKEQASCCFTASALRLMFTVKKEEQSV